MHVSVVCLVNKLINNIVESDRLFKIWTISIITELFTIWIVLYNVLKFIFLGIMLFCKWIEEVIII